MSGHKNNNYDHTQVYAEIITPLSLPSPSFIPPFHPFLLFLSLTIHRVCYTRAEQLRLKHEQLLLKPTEQATSDAAADGTRAPQKEEEGEQGALSASSSDELDCDDLLDWRAKVSWH